MTLDLIASPPNNRENNGPTEIKQFMGANEAPDGRRITVNQHHLALDGKPWLPVTGEFHYSRCHQNQWGQELLKIKRGGIDIVTTYVFWIHHEEIQNEFEWTQQRDLRRFVMECKAAGLMAIIRLGPWCHGEVRNGGLPDWLVASGVELRSDLPTYLSYATNLYRQIARQLFGLLWKDGGPVIGVQCENEYTGAAQHLLTLRRLAVDSGIDVPLYTRTGWPELKTSMPPGELLPLYGAYPDGFWDRSTQKMPATFSFNYQFSTSRSDGNIGTDQLGVRVDANADNSALDPYLCCEIGGGMAASYHRRIAIDPHDIEALALVRLGSGNNLQGYYMYHGGTNPTGKLSSLQESQATGYWNDLPEKSYDFYAPIGELGQIREHFYLLRRLHLFLHDFGSRLATFHVRLPDSNLASQPVRWSFRTDGSQGFLFVNNYQRLMQMPEQKSVCFNVQMERSSLRVPSSPINIPANSCFIWPVNMDMDSARLVYATAQPLCRIALRNEIYYVFRAIDGIEAEFVFDPNNSEVQARSGKIDLADDGWIHVHNVTPGPVSAIKLVKSGHLTVHVILLSDSQSLCCWKDQLFGRERIILSKAPALPKQDDVVEISSEASEEIVMALLPAPAALSSRTGAVDAYRLGEFTAYRCLDPSDRSDTPGIARFDLIQSFGKLRVIQLGCQGVAESPIDTDFADASVWRLFLPAPAAGRHSSIVRVTYVGDVARVYLNGNLITDNFYNGQPFEFSVDGISNDLNGDELLLKVLPLQADEPIYLPTDAWPDFQGQPAIAEVRSIELVQNSTVEFVA